MKKISLTVLLIIMLLSISSIANFTTVFADDYLQQYEYSISFDNGEKIFLMFPYTSTSNEDYLKTGLYYNSEPLENIYLINTSEKSYPQYFYKSELVFTDDGFNFVRLPWTQSKYGSIDGIAIEFYNNGALIKQYTVGDLIINRSFLEYSTSHVMWEITKDRIFDTETNTLIITALDGTVTEFNLISGDISSRMVPISCCFCGGSRNNGIFLHCICDGGGLQIWVWIFLILISVATVTIMIFIKKKKLK